MGLVRIRGHCWSVNKLTAGFVKQCPICYDALACRNLCIRLGHAVCEECHPRILASARPRCVQCRDPVPPLATLTALDAVLKSLLRDALVTCAECNSWSGAPGAIQRHMARCRQTEHACPEARRGCQWAGPLDELRWHKARCDFRPVACSWTGCERQILHNQKEAHEAGCGHRPATLGSLSSSLQTVQQLGEFKAFFQQEPDSLAALPAAEQSARLLGSARLFCLLYDAVATERPQGHDGLLTSCPWDCGTRLPETGLRSHYLHCANMPVSCQFCHASHSRRQLLDHKRTCEYRPVVCPDGCPQRGLRARDITTGEHALRCNRARLSCDYCEQEFPGEELAGHQGECDERPVVCPWCLDSHPFRRLEQERMACATLRLTDSPFFEGQPLSIQAVACGAVYVRDDTEQDTVFIRLPRAMLLRALREPPAGNGDQINDVADLTAPLAFVWAGLSCRISLRCKADRSGFVVEVASRGRPPENTGLCAEAALHTSEGGLVEELSSPAAGASRLRWRGHHATQIVIRAVNAIYSRIEETAFFLRLGPLFDDPADS